MNSNKQDKVYLLPQTIGHYQLELTRLLEFERYGEAMDMLRFLLDCETPDTNAREEWQSLLDWMGTMIPEQPSGNLQEEELSEEELFRLHLQEKLEREPDYADKLLEVFKSGGSWDKQVLALEQLRYLQHPRIRDVLLQWLESRPMPHMLQFRAMQILKLRGETSSIKLRRNGKVYKVDVSDVPTGSGEYPWPIQEMLQNALRSGKAEGFPLEDFAKETWDEFVAYAFGTPLYAELLSEGEEGRRTWAAAFHYSLLKTAQGAASEDDMKDAYGIPEAMEPKWERAVQVLADFSRTLFPSLS